MHIPKINLDKIRHREASESSATEKSDSTEVTEESSHDSSQEKKTTAQPSMSSSSSQTNKNPLASALASHRTLEKSTPPMVSPRSAPPSDTPPPLPAVYASSPHSSSSTLSSSSARPATPSSSRTTDKEVIVFKLPNPKVILKPTELARLLISAESMKFSHCLRGNKVDTILRSNTQVVTSLESDAKPVNINKTYLAPFMNKYFETPGVIKMQNTVVDNYTKQSEKILSLYGKIGDGHKFARSDEAAVLMQPLITPVINFICGKDMSLESSGLPKPVLELMLAVDEEVTGWFNKNGSGNPKDLQAARTNALISFFGTRSFMGTWTIALSSDKSKPAGFYRPLVAYLNTYLNLQIENFTLKLMSASAEQKKLISKQAAIFESRSAPAAKMKDVAEESSEKKSSEPEKTEKKGLLNFFNKERPAELSSPRGKKETEILHSPRRQLQRGETLQENKSRETTRTANRKKFVKDFIATHNLKQKEHAKFLISFQNSVVELSREEYKACKEDPLAYCISYIKTYTSRLVTRNETPQPEIDALWALKDKLEDAKIAEDE